LNEITATHQDLPVSGSKDVFCDGTIEDSIFRIEVDGVICRSQFVVGNGKNGRYIAILGEADEASYGRGWPMYDMRREGGIPGSDRKWAHTPPPD
jgi:hypothetical protein